MEAVQTTEQSAKNTPSFETVWAILQEVAQSQKETARRQEETDRIIKEEAARRQEEIDHIMKETARRQDEAAREKEKTDREMKEYNKRFGEFTRRFGEVVEYMIAPNLVEKFRELGYEFLKCNSGTRVKDFINNIHFEIDVMLENGEKALMVEVKTKLTTENVKDHIERIEKMRKYADLHGDKRSFLGAVASVVMDSNVKEYSLKQGLFVIEPSGESFNITLPNNAPKEW